jgi:hypothetical protein
MSGRPEHHPPEAVQDAAVLGVVIAGVLVSFTIPGPFDWGSSLIGLILLAVLLAYGAWPEGVSPASARRAIGMAAAAAFCALQILGRPLDFVVGSGPDARRLLSHWPDPSIKRDDDIPDPGAGLELLGFWFLFFVLLPGAWFAVERHGRRGATRASGGTKRPA